MWGGVEEGLVIKGQRRDSRGDGILRIPAVVGMQATQVLKPQRTKETREEK